MPDLLFEIGTEEMPALEVPLLAEELKAKAVRAFSDAHLPYVQAEVLYTARRLALLVKELAPAQEDRTEEVKGPPAVIAFDSAGNPTQAAIGFAKSQGVAVETLKRVEIGGKDYAFIRRTVPGRSTVEILPEILSGLVTQLHPSRSMRWDASGLAFIRPIRWLVCLYGDEIVPVTLGGLCASRVTRGHRFIEQEAVTLDSASTYEAVMADALVTVNPQARREAVIQGLRAAASERGTEYLIDEELLQRIVNGAEHPTPVLGSVPEEFLSLPTEVVHATLREEGKFVPFVLPDGSSPYFMGFRDGVADEKGVVRAGFEKVVSARLRDSRFFFEKDRQQSLAERVRELREVIYDVRLGSLWEKIERIRALAGEIAMRAKKEVSSDVDRAAFLCKADLVTEMVKAFPELQGIAGGIYSRLDGESERVSTAIHEHYSPVSFVDTLPESDVGTIISLADKLDTVVGALLVGEEPTGSRDPYGIKRQANGLIRLAIEKKVDVDFLTLLGDLKEIYATIEQGVNIADVGGFFGGRVAQLLRQHYSIPADVVVCISVSEMGNFYRALLRARALTDWQKREDFQALVIAFSRVRNITKSVSEKEFDPSLFKEEAERVLWREYLKAEGQLVRCLEEGDYVGAIAPLLSLKDPIDSYFDDVLVMTEEEDLRRNRLRFLRTLADLFLRIGDFSTIAVENAPP